MIVYADVLLLINFYVDYLLLLGTEKLCRIRIRFRRRLLGAAFSAACSLSVLWQDIPPLLSVMIRAATAFLTVFIAYGRASVWTFVRRSVCFLAATYAFAGVVLAFQLWLHPGGVLVCDGVVYWDVSPWVLLGSTTVCYVGLCLFRRLIRKSDSAETGLSLSVQVGERRQTLQVLYDTGNHLFDPISGDPVLVIDRRCANELLTREAADRLIGADWSSLSGLHCRMIPYQSVGRSGVMPAFRPDLVALNDTVLSKMYFAVSPSPIREGYDGIAGPAVIEEGVNEPCLSR